MAITRGLSAIHVTQHAPDSFENVAWGGRTGVGSALLVIVALEESGGVTSIEAPVGKLNGVATAGTYDAIPFTDANFAANLRIAAFVKEDADPEDSVDIEVGGVANFVVYIAELPGIHLTSALDIHASDTGEGVTANPGAIPTTTQADEIVFFAAAARRSVNYGNPTGGYTKRGERSTSAQNPSPALSLMVADKIVSATETPTATVTFNTAKWVAVAFSLKAAASAPGGGGTTLPDAPPLGYAFLADFDSNHAISAGAVEVGPPSDDTFGGYTDFHRQGSWQIVDLGAPYGKIARGFVLNDDGHVGIFGRPVDFGQGVRNPSGWTHGMFRYPTPPPATRDSDALVLAVSMGSFGGQVSGHSELVYVSDDPDDPDLLRFYITGQRTKYLIAGVNEWVSLRVWASLANPSEIVLRGTDDQGNPLPGFDEDSGNALIGGEVTGFVDTTGNHDDTVARWGMGRESKTTSSNDATPYVQANGGTGWTWDEDNLYVARGDIDDDVGPWLFEDPPAPPAAPTITSFTPASAEVGETITITGTNFTEVQSVQFTGAAAAFVVVNSTTITATVPANAETGRISVTTRGGTVVSATDFTLEGDDPPPPPPPPITQSGRSFFGRVILNRGREVEGARLRLYAAGTVDPDDPLSGGQAILNGADPEDEDSTETGLWTERTGGTAIASILSDSQGRAIAWGDIKQTVDVVIDDNGGTAHRPGNTGHLVPFDPYVEEGFLMPVPEDISANTSGTAALALAKTYTDQELSDHLANDPHGEGGGGAGEPTADAHIADAVDAHDASSISVVPFGVIAATDVQAALLEVYNEAPGAGGGAPATAEYLVAAANGTLSAEHVWATAAFVVGTAAAKPANPTFPGQVYIETDGSKIVWRGQNDGTGWDEIARGETGVRLAQLAERAHASLSGVGANDHHNQAHVLNSGDHTASGLTTGRFLRATSATAFDFETISFSKSATILNPTAMDLVVWRAAFACTVTAVRGYRVGGTGAVINARRGASTDFISPDLSLTSADTWMAGVLAGGVTQDVASGDKITFEIASVAGAPTQLVIQVDFNRP